MASMDSLEELKKKLEDERPVSWELFPDISLYMDQIVSYMSRQLIGFDGDGKLTPAMINNYIKDGLLPRAAGKKYTRDHIAYLTAICIFKQVIPVRDIGPLLEKATENDGIEAFYGALTDLMDREMTEISKKVPEELNDEQISAAAMEFAVSAYCGQFLCKRLIQMLADNNNKETSKKRKT